MPPIPYIEEMTVWDHTFKFHIANAQAESWYGRRGHWSKYLSHRNLWDLPMRNLIKPGNVVIDCGANQGWTTVIYAKQVGVSGAVHAIEANRQNCQRIHDNLALNDIRNVGVLWSVVGSDQPRGFRGECVRHHGVKVPGIQLDDFCDRKPDVVKVDVEGFECEVLKGARELMDTVGPAFEIEIHTIPPTTMVNYGGSVEELYAILLEHDYRLFRDIIGGGKLREVDAPDNPVMQGNVWAVKKGRDYGEAFR